MAEPERCGKPYEEDDIGAFYCERPSGHEPPAPEGCGPAERCRSVMAPEGDEEPRWCDRLLPCPEHGPEPADEPHAFVDSPTSICCGACGERASHPVHPKNAGGADVASHAPASDPSGSSAPERPPGVVPSAEARPPADDDLAGLAHDLCAAMEAGAEPEGLLVVLVARGWRPPGEGSGSEQDGAAHGVAHRIDRDALRARVAVIIGEAGPSTFEKADAVLDLLA